MKRNKARTRACEHIRFASDVQRHSPPLEQLQGLRLATQCRIARLVPFQVGDPHAELVVAVVRTKRLLKVPGARIVFWVSLDVRVCWRARAHAPFHAMVPSHSRLFALKLRHGLLHGLAITRSYGGRIAQRPHAPSALDRLEVLLAQLPSRRAIVAAGVGLARRIRGRITRHHGVGHDPECVRTQPGPLARLPPPPVVCLQINGRLQKRRLLVYKSWRGRGGGEESAAGRHVKMIGRPFLSPFPQGLASMSGFARSWWPGLAPSSCSVRKRKRGAFSCCEKFKSNALN